MTTRPQHLSGPEWGARWEPLFAVGDVAFVPTETFGVKYQDIVINGILVGSLEPRPSYCDRGHWRFLCELPDLDGADSFPRYYMDEVCAKREIISWLNWRLWRRRVS